MVNEATILLYLPTYVNMTMKYHDKLNVSLVKFSQQKYHSFGSRLGGETCRNSKSPILAMFQSFFLFEFEIFGVKIENKNSKKSKILINFTDQSSFFCFTCIWRAVTSCCFCCLFETLALLKN